MINWVLENHSIHSFWDRVCVLFQKTYLNYTFNFEDGNEKLVEIFR